MICLLFLMIRGAMLLANGGQDVILPATAFFQEQEGERVLVTGRIYKKQNKSNLQIYYLKDSSIFYRNQWVSSSKVIVYDETNAKSSIGNTITIQATILALGESRNPGNFSQRIYYQKDGIAGSVWCEKVLRTEGEADSLQEKLYEVRTAWAKELCRILGERQGGVLCAMLLADKSMLDDEVKELYQVNGIGHVLAISGLHVSFIGVGIYRMFRKVGCGYVVSGVLGIGVLLLYLGMIGWSVSVMRACVMLLFRIGADMSGRVCDWLTSLLTAAAITIAFQPLYLLDAGFLLSYGAILGIFWLCPCLKNILPIRGKLADRILSSTAVNMMLLPVLLYFYYEIPVYAIVLNVIMIPCMSLVLGAGLLGSLLLGCWEELGIFCLTLCRWLLTGFEWASVFVGQMAGSRLVTGQPQLWQMALYYLVLLGLCLWFSRKREERMPKRSDLALLLLYLGATLILGYRTHPKLQIAMLDVGQGDGIHIRGPEGGQYFIDGGSSDVDDVGRYRIEPYLLSQGVRELDYVFLSHGDSDHYSGIEELLQRQQVGVRIRHLVLPSTYKGEEALVRLATLAQQEGTAVCVMEAGMELTEGNLRIRCIQPLQSDEELEGNAASMVLEILYPQFSMLCTGDVEAEGEELLVERLGKRKYQVLKVAHHGSKNSTTTAFLEQIQAQVALISAGTDNSYGHPHEEVLERLEESLVITTEEAGCITVSVSKGKIRIVRYVEEKHESFIDF